MDVSSRRSARFSAVRVALVLIPLMTAILYVQCMWAPMIFDDDFAIERNPTIRHISRLGEFFRPVLDSPFAARPLVNMSFGVEYAFFGMKVWVFRITNMMLHVFCGWLILKLVYLSLRRPGTPAWMRRHAQWIAAGIALIWTTHPLHSETVVYVTQRTELMVSVFYMLTLYLAYRGFRISELHSKSSQLVDDAGLSVGSAANATWLHRHLFLDPSAGWLALAVITCVLGMACKEIMVSAPLAVWLYDRVFFSGGFWKALKSRWFFYLGLAATWALLLALVWDNPRSRSTGFDHNVTVIDNLRTQAPAIMLYLRLVFWPHPLLITYDWPVYLLWRPVILSGSFVVSLLLLTLWALWKRPCLGFLGACFFMILAPTSSVIPIVTEMVAERRMYLPSVAVISVVIFALAWAIHRLSRASAAWAIVSRRTVVAAVLLLTAILGTASFMRAAVYRDVVALWRHTVKYAPNSAMAWNNLGTALSGRGLYGEAAYILHKAVEKFPDYPDAKLNLGYAYMNLSRFDEAETLTKQCLEENPGNPVARSNLAVMYFRKGDEDKAIETIVHALRDDPKSVLAHNNLAAFLMNKNRFEDALPHLERVLDLEPENVMARGNLARVLIDMGRLDEASRQLDEAMRYNPDAMEVQIGAANLMAKRGFAEQQIERLYTLRHKHAKESDVVMELAAALATAGRYSEAEQQYRDALGISSESARAYDGLGGAIAQQGRVEEALAHYSKALELSPKRVIAMINIGAALMRLDRTDEAIGHYREALELEPKRPEAHYNLANALASQLKLTEAVEHYRQAVEYKPDYAKAYFNLGNALLKDDKLAEATEAFTKAIELEPNHAMACNNSGIALARQGRMSEAAKMFERALTIDPGLPDAMENLARARDILGGHGR